MSTRDHLRRAVLDVLWDSGEPVTAEQVRVQLPGRELAPTTVITILDRLRQDGLVERRRDGRSFRHWAVHTREDSVARTMLEAMHTAPDERRLVGRFLDSVSPDEARLISAALQTRCACGPTCGCGETCGCRGTENPGACTAHASLGR